MLVRRTISRETEYKGRQEWPEYRIVGQDVMMDPWEADDVAALIARAFSVDAAEELKLGLWIRVAGGSPFLPNGETIERVLEDRSSGYIYYRTPSDILRAQQWNQDRNFRVTAAQW